MTIVSHIHAPTVVSLAVTAGVATTTTSFVADLFLLAFYERHIFANTLDLTLASVI